MFCRKYILGIVALFFITNLFFVDRAVAAPFISTWDTTQAGSASTTIVLPITGSYLVNWGDNSTSTTASHVYSVATTSVTISVTGTGGGITAFRFNNGGDKLKIKEISQWGDLKLGNANGYFYGCSNLKITATDILNTTGTTNMSSAFRASGIDTVPSIGSWNMSAVTNMSTMFQDATLFNADIGSWNTSKVTNFSSMFRGATAYNNGGSASVNNLVTASSTDIQRMFQDARAFNQPIGSWNTSNVTAINHMFAGATAFDQDIGNWDTSKVTSINSLFNGATAFNNGGSPSINNWNVSNIITMGNMFSEASSFNQPVGSWNISKVTSMINLFYHAVSFNQDISSWDTSKVINFGATFSGATVFNNGGSSSINNWATASSTNMYAVFAESAFNQPIGSWNTSNVTDMSYIFTMASDFNQDISNWNTASTSNMSYMFEDASAFNQDISNWNVRQVTNMTNIFNGSGLSIANYSNLLIDWAAQSVKVSVIFGAQSIKYYAGLAASARGVLANTYNWNITDGGLLTYTFNYLADPNGTITGSSTQVVSADITGATGTAVTAVANDGYYFSDWSDGITANPRIDVGVTGDISVMANFAIEETSSSRSGSTSVAGRIINLEKIGNVTRANELREQFNIDPKINADEPKIDQSSINVNEPKKTTTTESLSAVQIIKLLIQLNIIKGDNVVKAEELIDTLSSESPTSGTTSRDATNSSDGISAANFTRDLEYDDEGEDVRQLQQYLINKGYSIPAGATGYFGRQTESALIQFQKDNNISPAIGYFGPVTRVVVGR